AAARRAHHAPRKQGFQHLSMGEPAEYRGRDRGGADGSPLPRRRRWVRRRRGRRPPPPRDRRETGRAARPGGPGDRRQLSGDRPRHDRVPRRTSADRNRPSPLHRHRGSQMKIALVGYGSMGRVVDEVAAARGVEVVDRFTRERPLRANTADAGLAGVTLIDFSVPEAVPETARAAAALSLPLVIGTTGWHDRM